MLIIKQISNHKDVGSEALFINGTEQNSMTCAAKLNSNIARIPY
jgi:hypothetical protein